VTYHAGSRRELAALAAALLLPIPLLVASGLVLPLPSGVERGIVSLLPGLDDGGGSEADAAFPGTSTSSTSIRVLHARTGRAGTDQPAAGVLSEGGNAVAPAAGNGAAGGDDSRPADMLPGDQRRPPGGGDGAPQPSAAPVPSVPEDPPESPAAPIVQERVTVDPGGLRLSAGAGPAAAEAELGLSEGGGVALTVDVSEDTSHATTVTVPSLPLPPLP
jgi:hypothetical protein